MIVKILLVYFSIKNRPTLILKENNVKIWDDWADKDGELGPIYGYQWRKHSRYGVQYDQIKDLIQNIKSNPSSRRLIVNSWNIEMLDRMTLPPCHYSFQFCICPDWSQ